MNTTFSINFHPTPSDSIHPPTISKLPPFVIGCHLRPEPRLQSRQAVINPLNLSLNLGRITGEPQIRLNGFDVITEKFLNLITFNAGMNDDSFFGFTVDRNSPVGGGCDLFHPFSSCLSSQLCNIF